MASSFYFLNNGNTVGGVEMLNQQENNMLLFGQPEIGKKRPAGKKNGKVNNSNQKKQSQRGLGVEKLERLRIMGGLKKDAEVEGEGSYAPVASHDPILHHHHQFNFPFTYGGGSVVPVHHVPFAAGFVGGPGNNNVYEVHQPVAAAAAASVNLGFIPYESRFVTGGGFTMVPMTTNQFHQAPNKELSSIQITNSISSNIGNSWNKKKKLINGGGEVLGYDGVKTEMEINDCDSLALSLGLSSTTNTERKVKACGLNFHDQEAEEMMTMQRKRNGGEAGRKGERVLMEYEFLPHHKGSTRSNNDNTTSVSEGRLVLGHEASPTNNTNFLDLSLKLSCYN